jgi:hypothetical protein
VPITRYGHCQFQAEEALASFIWLVYLVEARELTGAETLLRDPAARQRFRATMDALRAGSRR